MRAARQSLVVFAVSVCTASVLAAPPQKAVTEQADQLTAPTLRIDPNVLKRATPSVAVPSSKPPPSAPTPPPPDDVRSNKPAKPAHAESPPASGARPAYLAKPDAPPPEPRDPLPRGDTPDHGGYQAPPGPGYGYGGYNYFPAPGGAPPPSPVTPDPATGSAFRGVQGSLLQRPAASFSAPGPNAPSSAAVRDEDLPYESRQVLVLDESMDNARRLAQQLGAGGYRLLRRRTLAFGWVVSVLQIPAGARGEDVVGELRNAFPASLVDVNTRLRLLGEEAPRTFAGEMVGWRSDNAVCASALRVGLIDTPVDVNHPALRGAPIRVKSVIPSGVPPAKADHGTAIAALLSGRPATVYGGLLPDSELIAVNVFRERDGGKVDTTSEWVIYALDTLVREDVVAINLSLGGPPNAVLDAATRAVADRRVFLVAAAGNDGATAAPVYPAAYPQVLAVTAIDAGGAVYPRANSGEYVDFAAPGVDVWSAAAGGSGRYYTGTSFAVPFVVGALVATRGHRGNVSLNDVYGELVSRVRDLGTPGRDPVFGWGLVRAESHCLRAAGK